MTVGTGTRIDYHRLTASPRSLARARLAAARYFLAVATRFQFAVLLEPMVLVLYGFTTIVYYTAVDCLRTILYIERLTGGVEGDR